jgi:hypothetical protein
MSTPLVDQQTLAEQPKEPNAPNEPDDEVAEQILTEQATAFIQDMASLTDRSKDGDATLEMERLFQDAVHAGFEMRGSVGQKFGRDSEGGKSPEYTGNRFAKADFRKKWASMKLAEIVVTKEQTMGIAKVDKEKGTYRSLKWLIKNEGFDDTQKYITKCSKMGGPWVFWNEMFERYEFLRVEKTHTEMFTHAWQIKQKWISKASAERDGADDPKPGDTAPAEASHETRPADAGGKPKKKAKQSHAAHEAVRVNKKPRLGKDADEVVTAPHAPAPRNAEKDGAKTKNQFNSSIAAASNLLYVISVNDAWAWANNEVQRAQLNSAVEAVNGYVAKNTFAQEYLTSSVGDMKKKYEEDDLNHELASMSKSMDSLIATVEREQTSLKAMHSAKFRAMTPKA